MWTTHQELVVVKESWAGQSFSNLGHDQLKHYLVKAKDANVYSS